MSETGERDECGDGDEEAMLAKAIKMSMQDDVVDCSDFEADTIDESDGEDEAALLKRAIEMSYQQCDEKVDDSITDLTPLLSWHWVKLIKYLYKKNGDNRLQFYQQIGMKMIALSSSLYDMKNHKHFKQFLDHTNLGESLDAIRTQIRSINEEYIRTGILINMTEVDKLADTHFSRELRQIVNKIAKSEDSKPAVTMCIDPMCETCIGLAKELEFRGVGPKGGEVGGLNDVNSFIFPHCDGLVYGVRKAVLKDPTLDFEKLVNERAATLANALDKLRASQGVNTKEFFANSNIGGNKQEILQQLHSILSRLYKTGPRQTNEELINPMQSALRGDNQRSMSHENDILGIEQKDLKHHEMQIPLAHAYWRDGTQQVLRRPIERPPQEEKIHFDDPPLLTYKDAETYEQIVKLSFEDPLQRYIFSGAQVDHKRTMELLTNAPEEVRDGADGAIIQETILHYLEDEKWGYVAIINVLPLLQELCSLVILSIQHKLKDSKEPIEAQIVNRLESASQILFTMKDYDFYKQYLDRSNLAGNKDAIYEQLFTELDALFLRSTGEKRVVELQLDDEQQKLGVAFSRSTKRVKKIIPGSIAERKCVNIGDTCSLNGISISKLDRNSLQTVLGARPLHAVFSKPEEPNSGARIDLTDEMHSILSHRILFRQANEMGMNFYTRSIEKIPQDAPSNLGVNECESKYEIIRVVELNTGTDQLGAAFTCLNNRYFVKVILDKRPEAIFLFGRNCFRAWDAGVWTKFELVKLNGEAPPLNQEQFHERLCERPLVAKFRSRDKILNQRLRKIADMRFKPDVRKKLEAIAANCSQKIMLEGAALGDDGAILIAEFLHDNTFLYELWLNGNGIGDAGASAIGECLRKNGGLIALELNINQIGAKGAISLAEGLKHNSCLTEIDLMGNLIDDAGAVAFGKCLLENSALKVLLLSRNIFGDKGVFSLGDGIRHNSTLDVLYIQWNNIGANGLLYLAKVVRQSKYFTLVKAHNDSLRTLKVEVKKQLAGGAFGSVTLVEEVGDPLSLVVKKIGVDGRQIEECFENLILLGLPKHKNVIQLAGVCGDGSLALKAHAGGALIEYSLQRKGSMTVAELLNLTLQMSEAVSHLHEHGLLHRDIAQRNYVLSSDFLMLVLIDFGLAWPIQNDVYVDVGGTKIPWKQCPPEVLNTHRCYKSSDIWQLGLSFWQFLLAIHPFDAFIYPLELKEYLNKKMHDGGGKLPITFSQRETSNEFIGVLKELVYFCCRYDHAKRPSSSQVVQKIQDLQQNASKLTDAEKIEISEYQPNQDTIDKGFITQLGTIHGELGDDYRDLDSGDEEYRDLEESYESKGVDGN